MYKNIIFDFDGTIADSFNFLLKVVNSNPSKYGIDGIDANEIPKLRSLSMRYIFREFNINVFKIPRFVKMLREEMRNNLSDLALIEGMAEIISGLQSHGYKIYILTSNDRRIVTAYLKMHKISGILDIYSGRKLFKKHRLIKKMLRKKHLRKKETLYVGDEIRDIVACEKAGIDIASVTWGFNDSATLAKKSPKFLVDTPEQLKNVILEGR
ncbi:HAD-IA family hydrolase [Candidatus Nomurabacteria bacterium]|uniref:HAD-IA family hydrolase n=1 Tax=candidate division WWE3 bacterium TaxID=2053526 RepID=A0A955IVY8_UNCKA|nr:HAD-IA family hydrolase [candidate division WWE3 bacterium]MCB9823793.1 HAD-IA family hydrolase [Candidatus Nomurabacteria bacterium]MCB9826801.1 HAD-IA family hydrolase [Candidatus Nomurabacteria bacterium]MCB9827588.1 HAD-IA family hydrolase [Candidatus Nomurabacteria bacterium]HXK52910.1 HAD-IA family hydrolase [bacterium]